MIVQRFFHWFGRFSKRTIIAIFIIALLLLILRLYLPILVRDYVNRVLSDMPDYRGHVEEVDLHLWRGAYAIVNLKLEKKNGKVFVPFLKIPKTNFSVEWRALFHGSLVGEVTFLHPEINFVDGPTDSRKQLGISKSWGDRLEELYPLKINRFDIVDGVLTFRNPSSNPPVDLRVTELNVQGKNLSNAVASKDKLDASVEITGHPLKNGRWKAHLQINPTASKPTFILETEITRIEIPELNDFLKAYGGFDAEKGSFEVYAEASAKNGSISGYMKPIIEDLVIFRLDEHFDNPLQFVWEAIVAAGSFIFTNLPADKVATKIPFSGSLDNPDPDYWALFLGLLKNAYIEQIEPKLDGLPEIKVKPKDEDEKKDKSQDNDSEPSGKSVKPEPPAHPTAIPKR